MTNKEDGIRTTIYVTDEMQKAIPVVAQSMGQVGRFGAPRLSTLLRELVLDRYNLAQNNKSTLILDEGYVSNLPDIAKHFGYDSPSAFIEHLIDEKYEQKLREEKL